MPAELCKKIFMRWITNLNTPWLHFIVLGIVFYQLQGAVFPEQKTVIEPLSKARINALQQQWQTSTGQPPSQHQLAKLIETELNRDVLLQRALELNIHLYDSIIRQRLIRNMHFLQFANGKSEGELFEQALEMRLHLNDTVVKQRLIQVMQQKLSTDNPPPPPSKEEIEAEFKKRFRELRKPPLYSFEHLFFDREREPEVPSVVVKITQEQLDFQAARHLSSPYLQGHKFSRQTPGQLSKNFGKQFVFSLEQARAKTNANTPQWFGPIRSVYGLHYVWLSAFELERDAQLEEVEQQLRNDLNYAAQAQALQNGIASLREDYDVRGSNTKALESTMAVEQ
jgi:hypothetical protein